MMPVMIGGLIQWDWCLSGLYFENDFLKNRMHG